MLCFVFISDPHPAAHLGSKPPGTNPFLIFSRTKQPLLDMPKQRLQGKQVKETQSCLLLLKEGVRGIDSPLNREGGGRGTGERAGAEVPELDAASTPVTASRGWTPF